MSDTLDLCQLLYSAFMLRDSPVYYGADIESGWSQWRGSQWFPRALDPSHVTGTSGCVPYTCESRACMLLDKVCFLCVARCTALFSSLCAQQIKDPTAKSCSLQTWTSSNTALKCEGWVWEHYTYRKQLGGLYLCLRFSRAQQGLRMEAIWNMRSLATKFFQAG